MPPTKKRCPNGTRRDKKTGECVSKKTSTNASNTKKKRCPKGSRRNKKTGECVSYTRRAHSPPKPTHHSPPISTHSLSSSSNHDKELNAEEVYKMLKNKEHAKLNEITEDDLCTGFGDNHVNFNYRDYREEETLFTLAAKQCLDNHLLERMLECVRDTGGVSENVLMFKDANGDNFFNILFNLFKKNTDRNSLKKIVNLMILSCSVFENLSSNPYTDPNEFARKMFHFENLNKEVSKLSTLHRGIYDTFFTAYK